jgi:hypothetical protein
MKYFFIGVCIVFAWSLNLKGSSNPYSAYSIALEGARSHDVTMKDFLAPTWFFLPELTTQQKEAKNVLKDAFSAKFLTYPSQIQVSARILEELCPFEKHCVTSISQAKQCQNEKDELQKQCAAETEELKNQIQEFSKNLNSIKAGYDAIYMSNLTYTKAVEKLNKAYESLKTLSATENVPEIIKAIKVAYDLYLAATEALSDLNKSLERAQVTIEVAIPNGANMRRMINLKIKAENLGLKQL